MAYFEKYKKYYDALNENRGITVKSNELKTTYLKSYSSINSTYFSQIIDSVWHEESKTIIDNNIIVGVKNNLQSLGDFISNNLVSACDKAINSLLPIIEQIESSEKQLNLKKDEKNRKEGELRTLYDSIPTKYDFDAFGNISITRSYQTHMEKIASVVYDISSIMSEIESLIKELDQLCLNANSEIMAILELNANLSINEIFASIPTVESEKIDYDQIYYDSLQYLTENYNQTNETVDVISSSGIFNHVVDTQFLGSPKTGQYVMVTLSNGLKFPVYQQRHYPKIDGQNMGGGCSYFALASGAYYLIQPSMNPTEFLEEIVTNTSGQFGGMEELFQGRKSITIDGIEYTIDSDFSEKKSYSSSGLSKEAVVSDIETTLEQGGVVFLNIGKLTSDFTRNGVRIDSDQINMQTGIYSKGGHVITMTGIDENGKIIFADSNRVDISEERVKKDTTYYDKGLTVEEFYDLYGGNSPVSISSKYYYTATHADLVKVNDGNLKASN